MWLVLVVIIISIFRMPRISISPRNNFLSVGKQSVVMPNLNYFYLVKNFVLLSQG